MAPKHNNPVFSRTKQLTLLLQITLHLEGGLGEVAQGEILQIAGRSKELKGQSQVARTLLFSPLLHDQTDLREVASALGTCTPSPSSVIIFNLTLSGLLNLHARVWGSRPAPRSSTFDSFDQSCRTGPVLWHLRFL